MSENPPVLTSLSVPSIFSLDTQAIARRANVHLRVSLSASSVTRCELKFKISLRDCDHFSLMVQIEFYPLLYLTFEGS